jgi:hypothetical protein
MTDGVVGSTQPLIHFVDILILKVPTPSGLGHTWGDHSASICAGMSSARSGCWLPEAKPTDIRATLCIRFRDKGIW